MTRDVVFLYAHGLLLYDPTASSSLQVYPLGGRGLRVITGMNRDEGGADSNGAGKTSLVAAPLWALTGDMLARTEVGGGWDRNALGAASREGGCQYTAL